MTGTLGLYRKIRFYGSVPSEALPCCAEGSFRLVRPSARVGENLRPNQKHRTFHLPFGPCFTQSTAALRSRQPLVLEDLHIANRIVRRTSGLSRSYRNQRSDSAAGVSVGPAEWFGRLAVRTNVFAEFTWQVSHGCE